MSPGDLKPVNDSEHVCRGTLPLKNGMLTCGCFTRSDAPEPLTHKDVPGFDNLSNKMLRKFIVTMYMKSGFNNCKIQPLQMMFTDRPLELFVDPKYRDVRLGILEKVDINSPVRWLSRMIVTLKKDGSLIIKK